MREILFRGKTKKTGEWKYGFVAKIKYQSETEWSETEWVFVIADEDWAYWAEVIPETIGQFTGLKDKNGNKIFEGDIVVCRYANAYTPVFQNGIYMAYNPKEMQTIQQPSTQFNIIWRNGCEIIGNIHDNPELLK